MKIKRIVVIFGLAFFTLLLVYVYEFGPIIYHGLPWVAKVEVPKEIQSKIPVVQKIDYADKLATISGQILVKPGDSALRMLQNSRQTEVKTYSFGSLVQKIDGISGEADKMYWIYYVNGQTAKVGADQYVLQPGDQIEWRLEGEKT